MSRETEPINQNPQQSRVRGYAQALTDVEKALIISAMLEGVYSLSAINLRLAERGSLPISHQTLWKIKTDPDVAAAIKERREGLLAEMHGVYLDSLVSAGRIASKAAKDLLGNDDDEESGLGINSNNHKAKTATFSQFLRASLYIRDAVAPKNGGAQAALDAEQAAVAGISESGLDESAKAEVTLAVREATNDILRQMLERSRQPAPEVVTEPASE